MLPALFLSWFHLHLLHTLHEICNRVPTVFMCACPQSQGTEGLWVQQAVDPYDPAPEEVPYALPCIRLLLDKKAMAHLLQVCLDCGLLAVTSQLLAQGLTAVDGIACNLRL
jgi:hypothetical protein